MAYKLIISERAGAHLDSIIGYTVHTLKKPGAAAAILTDMEEAFDRLESMPESFAYCNDLHLAQRGYRKVLLSRHDYLMLFRIDNDEIHISGIFHMKEDYANKV